MIMKYLYLLLAGFIFFQACSDNEQMIYTDKASLYFPDYTTEADSLTYSFQISRQEIDTLYINVKLLGQVLERNGKYQITTGKQSTAIAGEHYVALPETFEFRKGKSVESFPLIVMNKGSELDEKTVMLELSLTATEDFDLGYPNKLKMRVMLTNQLIKPTYWDDLLYLYFGEYSKVKHTQCMTMMDHDFPLTKEECYNYANLNGYRYWMNWGRAVCEYYAIHKVEDENGNLITVWDPF